MHSNFIHMLTTIGAFAAALILFALALRYYRKRNGMGLIKLPSALKPYALRIHPIKLCFIFASVYFTTFIVLHHTGASCDALDNAAQCQCYALEVIHHKDLEEKLHWAGNGLKMCPDSKFFANFLAQHSQ